jgi:hypothetical protein
MDGWNVRELGAGGAKLQCGNGGVFAGTVSCNLTELGKSHRHHLFAKTVYLFEQHPNPRVRLNSKNYPRFHFS